MITGRWFLANVHNTNELKFIILNPQFNIDLEEFKELKNHCKKYINKNWNKGKDDFVIGELLILYKDCLIRFDELKTK